MKIKFKQLSPGQLRITKYAGLPALLCFILLFAPFGKAKSISGNDMAKIETRHNNFYEKQAIPVTGKITDENGEGLIGATVVIKGTTTGTTTDIDGNFSLEVPDESAVIVISYAGYKTQELPVGSLTSFQVKLEEDVQVGEDIVVVGYGQQKKTSVTGAISSVAAKEIAAVPVANISGALQGRAAGVIVTSNGAPGQAPVVRIRGNGSIGLSADPLYVVDGFPVTDPNFLNSFDNKDIENIEVLKDAAASAIYGSRASNGVVLITTKKGNNKDKKLHVNLDSYYGTQNVWKKQNLLNTDQYIQYATELNANAFKQPPPRLQGSGLDQPIYAGASQTYRQTNTNWQDAIFHSAPITQTNLSVSGGTDVSRIYASGGYFKQNGTLINTGYERANFRINTDHNISKRVKVGQTLTFAYGDRKNEVDPANSQGRSLIMHAIRSAPYLPIYDPTKLGGYRAADANDGNDAENPVLLASLNSDRTNTAKVFGTVFAEYQITDWLKFKTTEGIDYTNLNRNVYLPIFNDGFNSKSNATVQRTGTQTVSALFSNQLSFDKTFGRHTINAIAVAEQQSYSVNNILTTGNLSYNQVQQQNGVSDASITGTLQKNYLISYLGRINYDFAGKYLIGVSFRSDGSSKFAPGHRWGTFPAASVGWRVSQENFMKNIAAISELKFRGSYGLVGFNGLGNYDWQAVEQTDLTLYNYGANTTPGSYNSAVANPNLKWETSTMSNVGFDLGLFNNKFTFSAEYFNKLTENLILPVNVAPSLGYTTNPVSNIGTMRNSGFELQGGYNINKGGFKSNLTANLGFVRNKVIKLTTPGSNIEAGYNPDFGGYNITHTEAGMAVQSFYGWKTDGIFQSQDQINSSAYQGDSTKPGDIKFQDLNHDGKIDANDRTVLGSFLPKFTYGINYSASYKGFDVTLFFQGVQGNKIYNGTKVLTQGMVRLFNAGTDVLDAWTPTHTNTNVPRAVAGDPNNNARTSDRFVESGSYLRLKNVVVGYTIPVNLVKSITGGNISNIRIYFSSQNLFTITKYSGYDPEISFGPRLAAGGLSNLLTSGIDYGQAPVPRSFLGGIQIGF